uniref:Uncharacterized protein n=1 Tax=Nelumbo nucifera TaxID=4432 RepID=A0A822ZI06_NELNU|nr:TPA_asm: hypothetical protein HUJ06_015641 [Nelumbo nucifera]
MSTSAYQLPVIPTNFSRLQIFLNQFLIVLLLEFLVKRPNCRLREQFLKVAEVSATEEFLATFEDFTSQALNATDNTLSDSCYRIGAEE